MELEKKISMNEVEEALAVIKDDLKTYVENAESAKQNKEVCEDFVLDQLLCIPTQKTFLECRHLEFSNTCRAIFMYYYKNLYNVENANFSKLDKMVGMYKKFDVVPDTEEALKIKSMKILKRFKQQKFMLLESFYSLLKEFHDKQVQIAKRDIDIQYLINNYSI